MKFRLVDDSTLNSTMVNLEKVEVIQKRKEVGGRFYIAYILSNNTEVCEYFETEEARDKEFYFLTNLLRQFSHERLAK